MYSGAQSKQDFMKRVGSHATKGHGSRGVIEPSNAEWESLPTVEELSLAELQDERARLCSMKVRYPHGRTHEKINHRLGAVNKNIKRLNLEVNERYNTRVLYLALRDVCDDATYEAVLNRARQIRLSHEAHLS